MKAYNNVLGLYTISRRQGGGPPSSGCDKQRSVCGQMVISSQVTGEIEKNWESRKIDYFQFNYEKDHLG